MKILERVLLNAVATYYKANDLASSQQDKNLLETNASMEKKKMCFSIILHNYVISITPTSVKPRQLFLLRILC